MNVFDRYIQQLADHPRRCVEDLAPIARTWLLARSWRYARTSIRPGPLTADQWSDLERTNQ